VPPVPPLSEIWGARAPASSIAPAPMGYILSWTTGVLTYSYPSRYPFRALTLLLGR